MRLRGAAVANSGSERAPHWGILGLGFALLVGSCTPPGELVSEEIHPTELPLQTPTSRSFWQLETRKGTLEFRPRFEYDISGIVLSTRRYRFDDLAFLSPFDVALAWGPLAAENRWEALTVSQNWRFYFWRTDVLPLPEREIIRSSANVHIIPAGPVITRALAWLRRGDPVRLQGVLVDVFGERFRWTTSVTREDSGDGGCEVLWTEAVYFRNRLVESR
jgi:hypothetical protein